MDRSALLGRNVRRLLTGISALVLLALPARHARAQTGDGFLFGQPRGSVTLRGGYELANTASQPFTVLKRQTTVGARSFDAPNIGADLAFYTTRRADVVLSLDLSSRSNTAEYREWEENGQPIKHSSTLERYALGANIRYNFADRGRSISSLAWIPSRYIPYVGVGGGMIWYDLRQKGDFVEETDANTANIYTDELQSSSQNLMAQAFTGLDYRLNARFSIISEARYTYATARLVEDYFGLGNINLSGLALNVGTTIRF